MRTMSLGDVAQQIRGVTYKKEDARATPAEGYIALLRAGDITLDGAIQISDLLYVPKSRVTPDQIMRVGDILVASSSGSLDVVGKSASFNLAGEFTFGAFCKVIRPSDRVSASFIAHFMNSRSYKTSIRSLAAGANINNLKKEHLDSQQVPAFPLPEQVRIAAILDQGCGVLRAVKYQIESLADFSAALVERHITNSTPTHAFGELAVSLKNGLSPSTNGTYAGQVHTLSAVSSGRYISTAAREASFARQVNTPDFVHPGDFLVSRGNGNPDLVGVGVKITEAAPNTVFPDTVFRAILNDSIINNDYIEAVWATPRIRSQILAAARTTNGTFKINQQSLKSIVVPVLPRIVQEEIASQIAKVTALRGLLDAKQRLLEQLTATLGNRAFRGEL